MKRYEGPDVAPRQHIWDPGLVESTTVYLDKTTDQAKSYRKMTAFSGQEENCCVMVVTQWYTYHPGMVVIQIVL